MKQRKQFCAILLVLICTINIFSPTEEINAASVPSVNCHAYVIMDANTGKVLLSKNASNKIYPASTVKLMTALVALDKCKTTKKVTITSSMLKQIPSGVAKIGLKAGDAYTVSDLLHMLLLPSAADAAIALACTSCGSTKKFVTAMNQKAKKLNLAYTSFDNPIGLDIGNNYNKTYTTANSFATLTRYAMSNKTIRTIVAKKSYKVPKAKHTKAFTIKNTNLFLSTETYNTSLYEIIGSKTGTTRAAGSVLTTTAIDNSGHEVICAFFGNSTHDQMYKDIKMLLNYTFKQAKNGKLTLKKGFWDTRFRDTNTLIRSYYNKDKISVAKRFYPAKKDTQKKTLALVNAVADTNYKPINTTAKLTIKDLTTVYAQKYAEVLSSPYLDTVITEKQILSAISSYENVDNCTTEEKTALALLIQAKVFPSSLAKNVTAQITREQAVQIGDALKGMTAPQIKIETEIEKDTEKEEEPDYSVGSSSFRLSFALMSKYIQ